MSDHFHAILTPNQIALERAMQFIKGGFSKRAGEICKLEIWQKGFTDHRLRDWEDYDKHRHYIWMNPVKAQLLDAPEQYPYCSAFPGFHLDPLPQRLKPLVQRE